MIDIKITYRDGNKELLLRQELPCKLDFCRQANVEFGVSTGHSISGPLEIAHQATAIQLLEIAHRMIAYEAQHNPHFFDAEAVGLKIDDFLNSIERPCSCFGHDRAPAEGPCPDCNGTGKVRKLSKWQ